MRKSILIPIFFLLAGIQTPYAATTLPPTAPPSYGYEGLGPLPSQGPNRLYWNTIQEPRSLEMRGATWKDPALVPQLPSTSATKQKVAPHPRKTVKRSGAAKRRSMAKATPTVKKATPVAPLTGPNPHDEDLARRPVQPFDPFADSRPMPPERLQ